MSQLLTTSYIKRTRFERNTRYHLQIALVNVGNPIFSYLILTFSGKKPKMNLRFCQLCEPLTDTLYEAILCDLGVPKRAQITSKFCRLPSSGKQTEVDYHRIAGEFNCWYLTRQPCFRRLFPLLQRLFLSLYSSTKKPDEAWIARLVLMK